MISTHSSENDPRNEEIFIYINGKLYPKEEAKISVYDSGFLLGDGVWEGIRLHNSEWIFLDQHLSRFFEAAKATGIDVGLSKEELFSILEKTRTKNKMTHDVHARLMLTRGEKIRPFQHPDLSIYGSTLVIIMEHSIPLTKDSNKKIRLVTVPQVRGLPMSQDPKLNSHSKLNCVLACIQAKEAGGDEALMLDPHGFVNTTNACNFFIVRSGEVWTSTGDYCMNGITRSKVIKLCREEGILVKEKNFSLVETYSADEAFITGTFAGQTNIFEIDGKRIGTSETPITDRIKELYRKEIGYDKN